MKNDKHLEYSNSRTVSKLVLSLYLTEFHGFSSSTTLEIITLPTSGKSIIVKKMPSNTVFHLSMFRTTKV